MLIRSIGNVFEKRLIEAYIAEHHKDPVTNDDLENDDLIALQQPHALKPRPPTFTSIPSLLSVFQNEWDAMMLESYALRQTVSELKRELSHALYSQDASLRVIARITKERNEAREALSKMGVAQIKSAPPPAPSTNGDSASASMSVSDETMQVDQPLAMPPEQAQKIDEYAQRISPTRRKRPVPEGWTPAERIKNFKAGAKGVTLVPEGSGACAMDTRISEGGKLLFILP